MDVWLPKGHYLSFTNSPYYAHHHLAAIDIYPPKGAREVLSPIEGKLIFHKVIGGEHVLGFKSGGAYVRILHIDPYMRVGEFITVGDPLGEAVWSPTFFKWTDPHAHVEVRVRNNFVGARGCVRLNIHSDLVDFLISNVNSSSSKYIINSIVKDRYLTLKPYSGSEVPALIARAGNLLGVMEGGIPHYRHAGVIPTYGGDSGNRVFEQSVSVDNVIIGKVDFISKSYIHVSMSERRFQPVINGKPVYGVTFLIGAPFVKVIPNDWSNLIFREGDAVTLCFRRIRGACDEDVCG